MTRWFWCLVNLDVHDLILHWFPSIILMISLKSGFYMYWLQIEMSNEQKIVFELLPGNQLRRVSDTLWKIPTKLDFCCLTDKIDQTTQTDAGLVWLEHYTFRLSKFFHQNSSKNIRNAPTTNFFQKYEKQFFVRSLPLIEKIIIGNGLAIKIREKVVQIKAKCIICISGKYHK